MCSLPGIYMPRRTRRVMFCFGHSVMSGGGGFIGSMCYNSIKLAVHKEHTLLGTKQKEKYAPKVLSSPAGRFVFRSLLLRTDTVA